MNIAKSVFEAIDIAFNRKQNEVFVFENQDSVIVTKDVLYSTVDTKVCLLDYYYVPKKRGKYPVILNIHGGGFVAGGKEYRKQFCTWLALEGFFVINVNYGLSPDYIFPEPIKHLLSACDWIYQNRKQLKLDMEKVVVCGDSAGAYYASMLATINKNDDFRKAFKAKLKLNFAACVLICGLYDVQKTLETRILLNLNKVVFETYTGITEKEFEGYKFKDYISPMNFVNEEFPPTFLIYAEKDILCRGQTEVFAQKLDEKDVYYESYHTKSIFQNHCFSLSWTSEAAKEANLLMLGFLEKVKNGTMPERQSKAKFKIRAYEKRKRQNKNTSS